MESFSELPNRIYLDLDGVVYPVTPLPEGDTDIEQLHALEWWRTSVVEKLGSFGAEIVLSSSWGEAFMRGTAKSPREMLKPTRALSERVIMETSKIDVIVADLAAYPVGRAIWIEDEMTENDSRRFKMAAEQPLAITPEKTIGLTPEELRTIEEFLVGEA